MDLKEYTKRLHKLCDDNIAAVSIVCKDGNDMPKIVDKLEELGIKGKLIWCLYKDQCKGKYDTFRSTLLKMKERPSGIFPCGCNWGPSRFAKRTECFHSACHTEARFYCSCCFTVRYCSAECQKAAWRDGHKKRCKAHQVSILAAINKFGQAEAAKRLYILGLIGEEGIIRFVKKHCS
jgi:hypothetical protein